MKLKNIQILVVVFAAIIIGPSVNISPISVSYAQTAPTKLNNELKSLPGVVDVKPLKYKEPFKEKYLVQLKQWLNPKDTSEGSFIQRIFVSHYSYDAPTVLVTEGYAGSYAEREGYTEELTSLFNTNQILVEHRYFGQSTPAVADWKYLTASNAAADHHKVVTLFKTIYKNKWINTGISKGGQTALIHRALYPDDVDISVCYVGPLCFGVEDGRHEPFICCKVASESDREKVHDFQMEVLKRKNKIFPMFKNHCTKKNYAFHLPLKEIYDYCVLEFSFSFWQWGWEPSSIPSVNASDSDLFDYLIRVCSPDYFADDGKDFSQAFFVQAARELGYYGYETEPFKKYLTIKTAKGYLEKIFLPKDYRVTFDSTISQHCARFLRDNDPKMIFIYGEYDPWSAPAVEFTEKTNMLKAVCPGGSHATRIRSFSDDEQQKIIDHIHTWLE
ncbi:MAG TPA: S28 family serine protease [Bacteroidales bacterium]|nr:S28 family serine protease [Bacteroidales bacterium]